MIAFVVIVISSVCACIEMEYRRSRFEDVIRNRSEHICYLIAKDDDSDNLIGVVGVGQIPEELSSNARKKSAWLHTVYVVPDKRRMGIGTALIEETFDKVRTLYDTVDLAASEFEISARMFYESRGFELTQIGRKDILLGIANYAIFHYKRNTESLMIADLKDSC